MKPAALAVITFLLGFLSTMEVKANLCTHEIKEKHKETVAFMLDYEKALRPFVAFPEGLNTYHTLEQLNEFDYAGTKSYNELVLRCNRYRDDKVTYIERREKDYGEAKRRFPNNLRERKIHGNISYLGGFLGRYGYWLSRKAGVWHLKLGIEFSGPIFSAYIGKGVIDMPQDKAIELGIWDDPSYCPNPAKRQPTKSPAGAGVKEHTPTSGQIEGYGGARACRLDKDRKIKSTNKTALNHVKDFWKDSIEKYWSRPDFKVTVEDSYGKAKYHFIRWIVFWKNRHHTRPTYHLKLWSGMDARTIAHEAGHALGLDDEYPESDNESVRRECVPKGGGNYVMCARSTSEYPKGIYYWIMTRRYQLGRFSTGEDRKEQEFRVYPVKFCAPGFVDEGLAATAQDSASNKMIGDSGSAAHVAFLDQMVKSGETPQALALCKAAYHQRCEENLPRRAKSYCDILRAMPNGSELVTKCGYCRNRVPETTDASYDAGDPTAEGVPADSTGATTGMPSIPAPTSPGVPPNAPQQPPVDEETHMDLPEGFEYPED